MANTIAPDHRAMSGATAPAASAVPGDAVQSGAPTSRPRQGVFTFEVWTSRVVLAGWPPQSVAIGDGTVVDDQDRGVPFALTPISPLPAGTLAATPASTGSLLPIPFGTAAERMGAERAFLTLLVISNVGLLVLLATSDLDSTSGPYPLLLLPAALVGCGIATFCVDIAQQVSYRCSEEDQGGPAGRRRGAGQHQPRSVLATAALRSGDDRHPGCSPEPPCDQPRVCWRFVSRHSTCIPVHGRRMPMSTRRIHSWSLPAHQGDSHE